MDCCPPSAGRIIGKAARDGTFLHNEPKSQKPPFLGPKRDTRTTTIVERAYIWFEILNITDNIGLKFTCF